MKTKHKNIFLTSLDETKNRLDVEYFVCDNANGNVSYTTGISVAEAGIKYMLSQVELDEIIVIGSPELANSDALEKKNIEELSSYFNQNLESMKELEFLNYRIYEFMKQIDFELVEIGESVSDERKEVLKETAELFKRKYLKNSGYREFFHKLCSDEDFTKLFNDEVLQDCDLKEKKWIKYYIYNEMDSFYKMHMLEKNKDTIVRYIPITIDKTIALDSITSIVRETIEDEKAEINLYMDMQGLKTIDANTMISTFMLINRRIGYSLNLAGLIHTSKEANSFSGNISNVIKNYEIQNFISGIDLFLNFGKPDMLKQHRDSLGLNGPYVDWLFYGMDSIDEGITLCNVDLIANGIKVIKKTIQNLKSEAIGENIYLDILINTITSDYGPLLSSDELFIPELIKWAHRKGLYQQTLTIIESKVPEDMVKRGIYYYALNEDDINNLMEDINVAYWSESAKSRWTYSDIDHYFIKNYGRFLIDYRQSPDMVSKDFTRLKIKTLHEETGILKAYSELNNDDLLYEVLLSYYRIGNLRNQINHAIVEEPNMDNAESLNRKDNRTLLDEELTKFIGLYTSACKKTVKQHEPLLLTADKFRAYSRSHQLQPLEESNDNIINNSYTCQFNGKEVKINISMFKPEKDYDMEDED